MILKQLKYVLFFLLTFLLGAQATYAKTELILPTKSISFSIEQSQSFKSLEKEVQPNIGFLKEKSKFEVSESVSALNTCNFSKEHLCYLANAGSDWLSLKNSLVSRISNKQGWTLKYTDNELQSIYSNGKGLNLPDSEIEDIILNGCRPDKTFSASELISQSNFWNIVKERGYPNLFSGLDEYDQFSSVVKELASEWNLPTTNIFTQGSSLRVSNVSDIGDLDIAIKVDANKFDELVASFKSKASNPTVKARIGNNGKIGGVDMKKGLNETGSFIGEFYPKFENSFGQTFQTKLGVPSIQISIVKEGSSIDVSPFLNLK